MRCVRGVYFSLQLAKKIEWGFLHLEEMQKMGMMACSEFKKKYSSELNYRQLKEIYESISNHKIMR